MKNYGEMNMCSEFPSIEEVNHILDELAEELPKGLEIQDAKDMSNYRRRN